jgi:hypothetical protein
VFGVHRSLKFVLRVENPCALTAVAGE